MADNVDKYEEYNYSKVVKILQTIFRFESLIFKNFVYDDKIMGGKGGKNRPKGAAGAGQGKIAAKGDASKGASTAACNAEKKRAEANKP